MTTLRTLRRILSESTVVLVDYNTARNQAKQHGHDPDTVKGRIEDIVFNTVMSAARSLRQYAFELNEPRITFYDVLPANSKVRPTFIQGGKRYVAVEIWMMPREAEDTSAIGASSVGPDSTYDRKRKQWVGQAYETIVHAIRSGKTIYSRSMTTLIPITSVQYVRLTSSGRDVQVSERGKWVALTLDGLADMVHQAGGNPNYSDALYS